MKSKKKKKIVAVALLLFLFLCVAVRKESSGIEGGKLRRNEPGEGERQQALEAKIGGETYDVEISIEERNYTEKEARQYLKKAKKEIDSSFPGKNKSINRIERPVMMNDSYQDGAVSAEWSLDRYDILDMEGRFVTAKIAPAGEIVTAAVLLTCGNIQEEYTFCFHVYTPIQSKREKIETELQEAEKKNRKKASWELPAEVEGETVSWREKPSHRIQILLFSGVIVILLLKMRGVEEEQKRKKKREAELLMFYPQLVTTLSLLLGAGMSVSKAWERMVMRYKSGKTQKKNEAFEEMCRTYHEIRDGVGEKKAYENFGRRCGLPQYKKLASLLTQNIKKGTSKMAEMLAKEAESAQNQRKNTARKLGEEAGTKMLLPMMIMLAIVIVIVILPAVLTF